MAGKIGILALQGAFAKHIEMLASIGVSSFEVRYPHELSQCNGLILPGGESTTMTRQIIEMGFTDPLKTFAKRTPLFGTCAGMILMARKGILDLLDITVERNGYGRQCDSFSADLDLTFSKTTCPAFFIRAPRISHVHSENVKILATHREEAVCVRQGKHLAAAFHPELTQDAAVHKYFVDMCHFTCP